MGVHNNVMHPDEVATLGAIIVLYGRPQAIKRISAKDNAALQQAVSDGYILVDVGGGPFDHHSPEARKNCYANGVIKSAFGLILEQAVSDKKITEFELLYILQHGGYALQAGDNGQDFEGVVSPFEYVKWLNSSNPSNDEDQMSQFNIAVEMGIKIFDSMLESARRALPDHKIFVDAATKMKDGIVDLPQHMSTAVEEAQSWNDKFPDKQIFFFTFPERDGSAYRIQAVNVRGSFALILPITFRGLRGQELNDAAGISDGIFVHNNGFIAGATSLESCHKLGTLSQALQQWISPNLLKPSFRTVFSK